MSHTAYPHQATALQWLKASDKTKAILALDMGLGKTFVSSIDLTPPALVICPATLKLNWLKELRQWRPDLSVHVVKSAKDPLTQADVTIINYDILERVDLPERVQTLIVDEAHYIKNYKSKRTKHTAKLIRQTPKVRLLTGTPIVNRPIELWTLLYSIGATKLGYFEFGMRYCAGWKTPWDTYDFSGSSRHEELSKLLSRCMLRMRKEDVIDLPSKTFRVIELDLPVDKREKDFDITLIDKPDSVAFEAISTILKDNALRKLPDAIQYIKDALEQTDKVVVFAHHIDVIDELVKALDKYGPVMVTGQVKNEDRQKAVNTFQNDPKCRVFVANIKAAGVGLTLTAASHVIFAESSWSPADINQAADRCHRIGQRDNVTVDLLTISGSIDALVLHSVLGKMDVIDRIMKEPKMDTKAIAAKLRELADLFEAQTSAPAPAQTVQTPTPAPAVTVQPEAAPVDVQAAPTLDDIRTAMAKLIAAGKRDAALQIIKEAGAAKVSDIEPGKFASVMEAIESAHGAR